MPVPLTVTNWLATAYPSLTLNPQWLEDCCQFLQTHFDHLSPAKLIEKVESQILLSDLATCCASGPLSAAMSTTTANNRIAPRPLLLQVESIFEIGHSALSLKEVFDQRKEDKKYGFDRARIVGNVDDEAAEEPKGPAQFPRAMLQLSLSDGFTTVQALEYKRIHDLCLGETKLGSKLMIQHVRCMRDVLMLDPETVTFKGGFIQELDEMADDMLEAELARRLGLPAPTPTHVAGQGHIVDPQGAGTEAKREPDDNDNDDFRYDAFDDDMIDYALLDEIESHHRQASASISNKSKVEAKREADQSFDFGDDLDLDEAAIAALDAIEQSAPAKLNTGNRTRRPIDVNDVNADTKPSKSKAKKQKTGHVIELSSGSGSD